MTRLQIATQLLAARIARGEPDGGGIDLISLVDGTCNAAGEDLGEALMNAALDAAEDLIEFDRTREASQ